MVVPPTYRMYYGVLTKPVVSVVVSRHLARLHTFSCYVQPVTHECASDARILDGTIIPEI